MKKFIQKYGHYLAALALIVSTSSINSVCPFVYHQPVVPDAVKKLRKF